MVGTVAYDGPGIVYDGAGVLYDFSEVSAAVEGLTISVRDNEAPVVRDVG